MWCFRGVSRSISFTLKGVKRITALGKSCLIPCFYLIKLLNSAFNGHACLAPVAQHPKTVLLSVCSLQYWYTRAPPPPPPPPPPDKTPWKRITPKRMKADGIHKQCVFALSFICINDVIMQSCGRSGMHNLRGSEADVRARRGIDQNMQAIYFLIVFRHVGRQSNW